MKMQKPSWGSLRLKEEFVKKRVPEGNRPRVSRYRRSNALIEIPLSKSVNHGSKEWNKISISLILRTLLVQQQLKINHWIWRSNYLLFLGSLTRTSTNRWLTEITMLKQKLLFSILNLMPVIRMHHNLHRKINNNYKVKDNPIFENNYINMIVPPFV